jgi:hypothetical protein
MHLVCFLKHLEQTKHLEPYFNKYLEAYEFDLDNEAIKELIVSSLKFIITKTVYTIYIK